MKATRINYMSRNVSSGVLITLMVAFSTSCATKMTFSTSSVVPAAQGYVKVSKDKNKNYVIKISVTDLAEVERLQPPKQTYVVWMVTSEGLTKNIGQLKSSKSFMLKKLTAYLKTVSTFNPAKIFITAENDPDVQYPGDQVVLSTGRI
ncbi:MAG: hypothetical protein WCE64_01990 [Bacteroidales bacterium]